MRRQACYLQSCGLGLHICYTKVACGFPVLLTTKMIWKKLESVGLNPLFGETYDKYRIFLEGVRPNNGARFLQAATPTPKGEHGFSSFGKGAAVAFPVSSCMS